MSMIARQAKPDVVAHTQLTAEYYIHYEKRNLSMLTGDKKRNPLATVLTLRSTTALRTCSSSINRKTK